jgi:hypothetical protein
VNESDAALLRERDGQVRFGDGIHGGADDGDVQGMARVSLVRVSASAGSTSLRAGYRREKHVIEGEPLGDRVLDHAGESTLPGQCPGGVGLTTALVVLRAGWVIVGSLPTTDGTAATAQAGCLLVLNNQGAVVETITDAMINGPWDMTALDQDATASLFITNVLNGTVAANGAVVWAGSVVRIDVAQSATIMPAVQSMTVIGSGFAERTDPAALVIGPTGVALAPDGTLYVADTLNNRLVSIGDAVKRQSSAQNGTTLTNVVLLNAPLGLAVRPNNGDVLSVNGDNGMLIVFTSSGQMVSSGYLDKSGNPPGSGALFGLATTNSGLYFVDDATNTLNLLTNPL